MPQPRRTQAERREATIGKLLHATLHCLAERGYAGTSTSAICKAAGVSQGALFRHFDTRLDVIAAAIEQAGRSHVAVIEQLRGEAVDGTFDPEGLLRFAREVARSQTHAAWHEVMVAARTEPALCDRVNPVLARYEQALHRLARSLLPDTHPEPESAEVLVLTILHAFDSEAVTRRVHSSPAIEEARMDWAVASLRQAIGG